MNKKLSDIGKKGSCVVSVLREPNLSLDIYAFDRLILNLVPKVSHLTVPWSTIQSHGTKSHMLVSKLYSGTSKTKAGQGGLVRIALVWKSHCATCSPACVILYHVTGSCKGPIVYENVK